MADTAYIFDSQLPGGRGEPSVRLQEAARAAASWDVVHRPSPSSPGSFGGRIRDAARALAQLERTLAERTVIRAEKGLPGEASRSALRELRAHGRSLRTALAAISGKEEVIDGLPRALFAAGREEPRMAEVARVYLGAVDGAFSEPTFCAFVQAMQVREPLTLDELWSASDFLQFVLLESLLHDARVWLRSKHAESAPDFFNRLDSLISMSRVDWAFFTEPLIVFDALLRQDPVGAYERMDFESRQSYRKRVALIARHSDCTELEVAQAALDLARQGSQRPSRDPRMQRRRMHVGYYLIDKGFSRLAWRVGFHPSPAWRLRRWIRRNAEDCYIGGVLILSFMFLALALFAPLPQFGGIVSLAFVFIVLIAPAIQNAVDLINPCITALYAPEPLSKLDFSKGISQECATLVAVPSLLLNERQVCELVTNLEVRFLANREPNLHFALLTDLPDSVTKPNDKDSHPLVELAARLIGELNAKYASKRNGAFMLLHRHRIFNKRQGVWMGWERKRGKLLDLNNLLMGEFDAFPIKAGPIEILKEIRYILTLDSDTQLPRGSAARLAGAIAHPLNQAVIDPKLRIVTSGFGILQPRIGVAVRSTVRSRLATIFSGQNGFDLYTRAVSDAYQDLFAEGIFTGKGIYEVEALHAVLNHRFPRNALLSHDLIEGAYARAGLVTDIELIDDYPTHYDAYSRRQHRWMRGDWQIAQWIFSKVPDESGHWGPNPISSISRWKIFDNLRRSLLDPALMILFVAGWLGLPGGPLYWTIAGLCLLGFHAFAQLAFGLGRALAGRNMGQFGEALSGFGRALLLTMLHLILLAHQTMLTLDAVFRSLIRGFITGERTLEWETAAQAELQSTQPGLVDRYLAAMPLTALAIAAAIRLFAVQHDAIFYAAPMLVAWSLSGLVTTWLNRRPHELYHLTQADQGFLLVHALRCWRYFYQFSSERHNFLIPDNVEEDGQNEAARVSPTNIGMLLNARQAACELGFLTVPEFAELSTRSLASITRLETFRGNLYNWYSTETLRALDAAPFTSSVDSGNLVASLYTLHAGARELRRKPLLDPLLFSGLRAHWKIMRAEEGLPTALKRLRLPGPFAAISAWIEWLPAAESALSSAAVSRSAEDDCGWWLNETLHHVSAIRTLLREYLPWMLPEYKPLRRSLRLAARRAHAPLSIEDAIVFAGKLVSRIEAAPTVLAAGSMELSFAGQLSDLLLAARENLLVLARDLLAIEQNAERLAVATDFSFFVNPGRQVLSIGYDAGNKRVSDYCYELFASEARMATFLAIARGDLKQQSWFKLEREHTYAFGQFLPFSWTGTMFEYLMPGLWMHSHRGTLISCSESACVQVQRAFTRSMGIPWGISESGNARKNDAGNYCYHAYGLPPVALSPDATAGPVISPYSTFLALGADPYESLSNLRRMQSEGWVGAYGFYEAADYSRSLRTPVIVRQWMAHHQGMSLLAITNLLRNNIIQHWFHSNPVIQATELLLHEKPPSKAVLRARLKELTPVAGVLSIF